MRRFVSLFITYALVEDLSCARHCAGGDWNIENRGTWRLGLGRETVACGLRCNGRAVVMVGIAASYRALVRFSSERRSDDLRVTRQVHAEGARI